MIIDDENKITGTSLLVVCPGVVDNLTDRRQHPMAKSYRNIYLQNSVGNS